MRPQRLNPLFADIASLAGVGPAMQRMLARLDIQRVRDLLFHLPVGWRHTRHLDDLSEAEAGLRVALRIAILRHEMPRGRGPLRVIAQDAAGIQISLAFFGRKGPGLARRFPAGRHVTIAGQLQDYQGQWQMIHPEIWPDVAEDQADAVYPLTAGLSSSRLATLVEQALERVPDLEEWIDPALLARESWPDFATALQQAHSLPKSEAARNRLAYDELLASQLSWALVRARRQKKRGLPLRGDRRLTDALLAKLPFRLTGAQTQAVAEIAADLAGPHAMLRLLQGDVGSGKTMVALMALLIAVEAGVQGTLLAPTDLLARQHYDNIRQLVAHLPVRVGFLSGRDKGRARKDILAQLAAGEIDILIGTHALFSADVHYARLGLAIIDEQHRFGVTQRMMLTEKAERPPHLLVMTATPIPRSLALANYGEMDISKLDERPPGRLPIDTRVIALARLPDVIESVGRHLQSGGQAYWVCPLLEAGADGADGPDSDSGATSAISRAGILRQRFGESAVALVHGKLSAEERDTEMARFQQGEAQLLVATTVIEVGVDVANASLIVIESAERFGLAQLHQLRGRVGRGSAKSVCLLLRGDELSATARARLKMMRESEDGFAIAEADLELRGAGELLGTRQSGEQGFVLASAEQVNRLLPIAHMDARLLVEQDATLQTTRGEAARLGLYLFEQDEAVQTLRSG